MILLTYGWTPPFIVHILKECTQDYHFFILHLSNTTFPTLIIVSPKVRIENPLFKYGAVLVQHIGELTVIENKLISIIDHHLGSKNCCQIIA